MCTLIATLIALMLFAATPVVTVLTTALTLLPGTAHAGRWKADDTLLPGDTFKDCRECPEMVVIPAGTFRMGDISGDDREWWWRHSRPVHEVRIEYSFAVGKYEVTQAQWQAVMGNNPSYFNGEKYVTAEIGKDNRPVLFEGSDLPVENVSWHDAKAYIRRLNAMTGERYSLLSEAEWEYAARARTETKYPWGNTFDRTKANGYDHRPRTVKRNERIYGQACGRFYGSYDVCGNPKPVGSYPHNNFGLYDMNGNVWEWVDDCGHIDYNGAPSDGSAWVQEESIRDLPCYAHNTRGGGFALSETERLRSAARGGLPRGQSATFRSPTLGFRVARALSQ